MCTQIHIMYTIYSVDNSTVVGREGGRGGLQGLSYYFPRFQQFPLSNNNNRSKIKDQNHV